jgi:hypothetical protein
MALQFQLMEDPTPQVDILLLTAIFGWSYVDSAQVWSGICCDHSANCQADITHV